MRSFKLWHSVVGTVVALAIEEALIASRLPLMQRPVLAIAVLGAIGMLYVATEVVEEVRAVRRMMLLLAAVISEFVIFFAFQYFFLLTLAPDSFPSLALDPASLILNSLMVFVFNPLYLPATTAGRTLLIINTVASLGLVFFVLQNIWQLRNTKAQ